MWYTTANLELDDSHVANMKILKFKMADGCHFRNRFLAINQQSIVRFRDILHLQAEKHCNRGHVL